MARPKKNNADYFSHDADMRNDNKIKAVRRKFGITGYAIYVMLLEHLSNCDFFEFEDNELNLELISGDFDVEPTVLNDVLEYFKMLKLISRKDGKIYCEKLINRFESLLNKRTRQQVEKVKKTTKTKKELVIADENPQSKVKESKVKETKEEEREEKDLTPFELIQKEKPSELETWKMQNLKSVHDFDDLIELFNNKAMIEILSDSNPLTLKAKQLIYRFKSFAKSWISNQQGGKVIPLNNHKHDPNRVYFTTNINTTIQSIPKDKWLAFKANEELGGRIFTVIDFEEKERLRNQQVNSQRYAN